jgi:hypothetical protein
MTPVLTLHDDFPHREAAQETINALASIFNFPEDPPTQETMLAWANQYVDVVETLSAHHGAQPQYFYVVARINLTAGLLHSYFMEIYRAMNEAETLQDRGGRLI